MKNLVFFLLLGVGAAVLLVFDCEPPRNRLIDWVEARLGHEPEPEPAPVEEEPEPEPEVDPLAPPEVGGRGGLQRADSWIVYRALDGGEVAVNPVVGTSALVLRKGDDGTVRAFVAGRLTPKRGTLLVVTFDVPRVPPDDFGTLVAAGPGPRACVLGATGRHRCAIYAAEKAPPAPAPPQPPAAAGDLIETAPPPRPAPLANALARFEPRWPADVPASVAAVRAGDVVQALATVPVGDADVPLFIRDQVCGEIILLQDLARSRVENDHVTFEALLEAKQGDKLPALGSGLFACTVPGAKP